MHPSFPLFLGKEGYDEEKKRKIIKGEGGKEKGTELLNKGL